jgi:large subunit ribosomal protein L10
MALKIADKKAIVAQVTDVALTSSAVIAAEYRGLTVGQMTRLRQQARKSEVSVKIVRNTLAIRAFEDTAFVCLHPILQGPLILIFSRNEPGAAARLVKDFVKLNDKLIVKGIAIDGQLLDAKQLDAVASLPTKEEALSLLVSVLKAPMSKFVRTLAAAPSKLARTMAALRDKKETGS